MRITFDGTVKWLERIWFNQQGIRALKRFVVLNLQYIKICNDIIGDVISYQ